MELSHAVARSIASLISQNIRSFTPGELAEDVAAQMEKPKEEILRAVIEYCTDLVWIGVIGSTTSVLYTKADTVLVIWRMHPFAKQVAEALAARASVPE